MKKIIASAVALVATSSAAFAVAVPPSNSVPEISALEGTAAVAALAAIVLIAWERRRRAV